MSKELIRHLIQEIYYDNVDRGDMTAATQAFHPDVEWSHAQVWAHHDFARGHAVALQGRAAVFDFLQERVAQLKDAAITHHLTDLVWEGDRGAYLGVVRGPGPEKPFMVWIELRDGLIGRYTLRPL